MPEESEMAVSRPDQCRCPKCLQGGDHKEANYHREMRACLAARGHGQPRLYAAVEANRNGRGGIKNVSMITGLCAPAIASGRRQLADLLEGRPLNKQRKPGAGRKRTEQKYPEVAAALEEMLSDEVAGSPEGDAIWVRGSCRKLAKQL